MRTRRLLPAKNLRYAVGEIFLIVIGVSLALMASAWYENAQEQREELFSLQQLRAAVETDLARVEALSMRLRRGESELLELFDMLQGDNPPTNEMESYFGAVTTWHALEIQAGPYEELKNRGLSLISRDSLRSALVDLYERRLVGLQTTSQADVEFSSNQVVPYFNEHFIRQFGGEWAWIPVGGYEALRSDIYFRNLLLEKLRRIQRYFLPACERYSLAARSVLGEIESEIARLVN